MSTFTPHTFPSGRGFAAALAAAMALVPATAQAKPADTDGPVVKPHVVTTLDVRSPDARDAAQPTSVVAGLDVRSPDARDAGQPTSGVDPKPIAVVHTGTPASSEFDWPSAGIGAGIVMAIALLGFTAFTLSTGRKHGGRAALS